MRTVVRAVFWTIAGLLLAVVAGLGADAQATEPAATVKNHHRHWCDVTRWRDLNLIQGASDGLRAGEVAEPPQGEIKWRFDADGLLIFLYRDRGGVGTRGWVDYWLYDEQGHPHHGSWWVSPKACGS